MQNGGTLDGRGIAWLAGGGDEGEIVLSTRVRLARNLQGFPFPIRAGVVDSGRILDRARAAIEASARAAREPELRPSRSGSRRGEPRSKT